tara:strand:- start:131 stop:718 length:588 start_codon:yes stop_codon:yes gene_type:complete
MKAKLKSSNLNFDYYNVYSIKVDKVNDVDVGVNANVYKIADNISCYNVEINDVEPTFYVNGRKTLYNGFKTIYTNLYGAVEFDKHVKNLEDLASQSFISSIKDKELLVNLTPAVATKYIKRLLKDKIKYPTLKTLIKTGDKVTLEFYDTKTYSSHWLIKQLAEKVDKSLVAKHDCQYTNGTTCNPHFITIVDSFI